MSFPDSSGCGRVVVVAAVAALVDVDIEAVGDDDDVVGDIAVVGTGGVGFISFWSIRRAYRLFFHFWKVGVFFSVMIED